jgi:hypothetical protein
LDVEKNRDAFPDVVVRDAAASQLLGVQKDVAPCAIFDRHHFAADVFGREDEAKTAVISSRALHRVVLFFFAFPRPL